MNNRNLFRKAALLGCGIGMVTVAGCSTVTRSGAERKIASDETVKINIASTTDLHGYITEQSTKGGLTSGGVDVMAGYLDIARSADPETLLVDSGDLFQGTIISNTALGAPVVRWMNYARYDAVAVGNHDFDFGPGDGNNVVLKPGEDPLGALKQRETQAQFSFLSANICAVDEDPGHCASAQEYVPAHFVKPYIIKQVHGVQVAIIGLTTTVTPVTTMPSNVAALRFMPLKETLERFVPEVKAKGADVVIVAMHEGGFCDHDRCNPKDPLFQLIDSLNPEIRAQIPLILGGHTHSFVNTTYNGVHVTISGSYGQAFGYSTLEFHPADKTVNVLSVRNVDFCAKVFPDTQDCTRGTGAPVGATFLGQPVTRNPAAIAMIEKDIAQANAAASRVVGKLLSPLSKDGGVESTLGEFEADAFRNCFDSSCKTTADIAFQNNGGIRTSSMAAGPITYGQVFELLPFDNVHADLELEGRQVHDLLVAWYKYNGKSFNQISGLKIHYDPSNLHLRTMMNAAGETQTLDDPITRIETSDGQALNENQSYHVVVNDFLATGGSGTGFVFKGLKPVMHYERKQRDEIVDYLQSHPEGLDYSKQERRILQGSASAPVGN